MTQKDCNEECISKYGGELSLMVGRKRTINEICKKGEGIFNGRYESLRS